MLSVDKQVIRRIYGKRRGWCFTPKVFGDLGSAEAVRIALFRLARKGIIRRLGRGLYDYPKKHPTLGCLSPDPVEIARALSARDATRLQPSGAYAANLLGLSDQVPAKVVFLTDGRARRVRIGRQEIVLKNTTPRNMAPAGRISGTVIQALRHIGQKQLSEAHIGHLRKILALQDKKRLTKDKVYAPAWMHPFIDAIVRQTRD